MLESEVKNPLLLCGVTKKQPLPEPKPYLPKLQRERERVYENNLLFI